MTDQTPMERLEAAPDNDGPPFTFNATKIVRSDDLASALAEITRLTADVTKYARAYDKSLEREAALTADCARKDAALEPFADEWIKAQRVQKRRLGAYVSLSSLRAAASARGEGSGR